MNDEDVEDRLRRALHAHAHRLVEDTSVPPLVTPSLRRRGLVLWPALATAAAVAVVATGSVVLQASTDAAPSATRPPTVDRSDFDLGSTGTATPDPRPTAPATAPARPSRTTVRPPRPTRIRIVPPTRAPSSRPAAPTDTAPTNTVTPTRRPVPPRTHQHRPTDPTDGSTSTQSTPPTPSGSAEPCASTALMLSVGGDRMVGTDGGDYTFLELRNTGPECELDGYPVVTVTDGSGAVIGAPAAPRPAPAAQPVRVASGASAEFEIYDFIDNTAPQGDACQPDYVNGRQLRVTPPGSDAPIVIFYGYSACRLSVTAIHLPTPHP